MPSARSGVLVVQQYIFSIIDLAGEKVIAAAIGMEFLHEFAMRANDFFFTRARLQAKC